jgi:hypothetical protein
MKTEKRYFTHAELCELLDVPEDSALAIPDDGFRYDCIAEMWVLEMNVGTNEEIEVVSQ